MPRLPRVSGFEAMKALARAGFQPVRRSGSHAVLKRGIITFSIPMHDELKPGTLRAILRQAGVSVEEFRRLL